MIILIQIALINAFVPCDNWKTLFFMQNYLYPVDWCDCQVATRKFS